MINDPDKIITKFNMELGGSGEGEICNDGFGIDKEYIATFSKQMDEFNAGYMRTSFLNSKKIGGKDLYLVFIAPGYLTRRQKFLLRLIERFL